MIQNTDVKITHLEPMRVASITINSEAPEAQAIEALLSWARPQGLLDKPFRFFGYDSCQPYPNHTYTTWLTVGQNVQSSSKVSVIEYPGGDYLVLNVTGVQNIAPGWAQLRDWLTASDYDYGDHNGLEEMLDILTDTPLDRQRIRLYLPISQG